MPRAVLLREDRLVIRLTGLLRWAAVTGEVAIPYRCIRLVSTEPFDPPRCTLRWLGTAVPFTHIREGHFRRGRDWYFLSFEDRRRVVRLDLEGFTLAGRAYRAAVLGADDPEALRRRIEERMQAAVGDAPGGGRPERVSPGGP
jgi:hypothetical protein